MSSIFNRIFQYRQREQRTPREDYFTETFVAVIEKYDELRIALAAWLSEVEDIRSVRIETQQWFTVADSGDSRRPDIWMEAKDVHGARHWIIVENKIDSGERKGQLTDYAKILKAEPRLESRNLVYITKYSSETVSYSHDGVKSKHLRWPQVYDFLQEKLQDASDCRELAKELLKLMEDWNMDGALNVAHLRAAVTCFDSKVGEMLQGLLGDAMTDSGIKAILDNKMNGKRWARSFGDRWVDVPGYGIAFWIGFRFDRRDKNWNVEDIELPSPFVAVNPIKENREVGERLPQPSDHWVGPWKVEKMNDKYKWVRQPVEGEIPRLGEPLGEFYKKFFQEALVELKLALEGIG